VSARTFPATIQPPVVRPTRTDLLDLLRAGQRLMPREPGVGHSAREFWRDSVLSALEREKAAELVEAEAIRRAEASREIADLRGQGRTFDVGTMDSFGRRFGVKVIRPGGAR
jgi:hypothetical protein